MNEINDKFLKFYKERDIGNKTVKEEEENLKKFFNNMDNIDIDSCLAQKKLHMIRSGETNAKKH